MSPWRSKLNFKVHGKDREDLERRAEQVILDYLGEHSYENVRNLVDVEMEVLVDSESSGFSAQVYVKIK